MANLILIRHSISRQQPGVSSHQWDLTDEGRARCQALAQYIKAYQPGVIVTSEEPKARLTGQLVAAELNLPLETEFGLHEHRRDKATYFATTTEFEATVRELLLKPDELVYGEETGAAARIRFQNAIDAILSRHPGKTVAAVTHGTVMSLFLAHVTGIDPVAFWQNLGMPAYVVHSLPDYAILRTENDIV